jgi:hypothetical protein
VAALCAAALLGGPARAVPRGVPPRLVGGDRIECFIWDAEQRAGARADARSLASPVPSSR